MNDAPDDFQAALWALHDQQDVAELVAYLRSDKPLESEQRRMLADLLDLLHAKAVPPARGRPNHNGAAWKNSAQLAAYIAERFRQQWRMENGTYRVPATKTDEFCRAAISELERHSNGTKSADLETVKDIVLRGKLRIP